MIETFLIALREGLEASLIVMTTTFVLRREGKEKMYHAVWFGAGAAVVASVISAYILQSLAANYSPIEGVLMLVAAVMVTSMVVWMWKHSKTLRSDIETKIHSHIGREGNAATFGVFFFVFLVLTREGIELALFIQAISQDINSISYFLSLSAGLVVSVLLCLALARGFIRMNIGKFLRATALVLLFFVTQLLFDSWHELTESDILPYPGLKAVFFMDYMHDEAPLALAGLVLFACVALYFIITAKRTPKLTS